MAINIPKVQESLPCMPNKSTNIYNKYSYKWPSEANSNVKINILSYGIALNNLLTLYPGIRQRCITSITCHQESLLSNYQYIRYSTLVFCEFTYPYYHLKQDISSHERCQRNPITMCGK